METNCLVLIKPGNSKENIVLNRVVKGRTEEAEIAKGSVYGCREILFVRKNILKENTLDGRVYNIQNVF